MVRWESEIIYKTFFLLDNVYKQRIVHEIFHVPEEYIRTSFLSILIGQFGQKN